MPEPLVPLRGDLDITEVCPPSTNRLEDASGTRGVGACFELPERIACKVGACDTSARVSIRKTRPRTSQIFLAPW